MELKQLSTEYCVTSLRAWPFPSSSFAGPGLGEGLGEQQPKTKIASAFTSVPLRPTSAVFFKPEWFLRFPTSQKCLNENDGWKS